MRRTVRNGLIVAGMAGGVWFLGQATAQASDQSNVNGNDQAAAVEVEGGEGSSGNLNATLQGNVADTSTTVVSAPSQHTGNATNTVSVTAPAGANVEVKNVEIVQKAESGSIEGGNQKIADLPQAAPVSQSNVNHNEQKAVTEVEEDKKHPFPFPPSKQPNGPVGSFNSNNNGGDGGDAANVNLTGQLNLHDGSTTVINKPVQTTGDATNTVNLDFSNATFYCGLERIYLTTEDPQKCEYTIKVEGVTIHQTAKSGDIIGGNQVIGYPHHENKGHHEAHKPAHQPKPAEHQAAPVVHKPKAQAVTYKAVSSAQPKGQLAYTGADVSVPLTVGLLTLMSGLGLALAGRRRTEAQAG